MRNRAFLFSSFPVKHQQTLELRSTCIWDVLGWTGVRTLALTEDVFVILLRASRKNLAYLKLGNVRFLSHPFQFIII
jgi:hypothetical protein